MLHPACSHQSSKEHFHSALVNISYFGPSLFRVTWAANDSYLPLSHDRMRIFISSPKLIVEPPVKNPGVVCTLQTAGCKAPFGVATSCIA